MHEADDPTTSERAEKAFREWLAKKERGEAPDLATFAAGHPELAAELRRLAEGKADRDDRLLELVLSSGDIRLDELGATLRGDVETSNKAAAGRGPATAKLPTDRPSEAESASRRARRRDVGPGDRIGPYRLLDILGEGGFGRVFLAEQEEPVRRRVALKVVKLGMDTNEVIARFEAERQALALMTHPSIARVFDAGATDGGRPYFVLEHVPGVAITEYCDRHELPVRERLELFAQVCEAVQHAHQKGVIHRDIKPSNILCFDRDGERAVKIIDFGVAKALDRELSERTLYTRQGVLIGTPEYMSPEQAGTTPEDVDTRTDIWSLGVLLYELLSGTLPHPPDTLRARGLTELQRTIREVDPPVPSLSISRLGERAREIARRRRSDPRSLRRELRGDLDRIVMKALEKDRVRRYPTASELAADVRRYLRHEPILAAPQGVAYRTAKFVRRHRRGVAIGAIVIASLIVATVGALSWADRRHRAGRERTASELLSNARNSFDEYRSLANRIDALESAWRETVRRLETWQPTWERSDELRAWRELVVTRERIDRAYDGAVLASSRALEEAPDESILHRNAERLLEDLYWERWLEAEREGSVELGPDFYRSLLLALGLGTYTDRLSGARTISIASEPPGAEVWCFRFEEREQRFVPLPFDARTGLDEAAAGILSEPPLVVDRVLAVDRVPFEAGDVLRKVGGTAVSTRSDLVRALEGVGRDASIPIELVRDGNAVAVRWTPFSSAGAIDGVPRGRILRFDAQLGFTVEGAPLLFAPRARAGITSESRPLELALPRGSYLLVLRKEGHDDTRVPVAVPGPAEKFEVRLPRTGTVPAGFVFVPAGPVAHGGDPEAFQPLERGVTFVADFAIERYEVTVGNWLEFVNDPEVLARTSLGGLATPVSDRARELLEKEPEFLLIPSRSFGSPYWMRSSPADVWSTDDPPDWPIELIPHVAAVEYADWLTRKRSDGWRYRLPTDLEWEKAARGVDRRIHVWGNYLVWTFSWCDNARVRLPAFTDPNHRPIGAVPTDVSVYGVRDLAGSVEEHTADRPDPRYRFRSRRGGGWFVTDAYFFRIATRNGLPPNAARRGLGFRLAAEREE